MELPSKGLLSAVLSADVSQVSVFYNKCEYYTDNGNIHDEINIYELMHLMKEWAKTKQIMITVYNHLDTVAVSFTNKDGDIFWSPPMSILTEFEAVTKACEWILNEK